MKLSTSVTMIVSWFLLIGWPSTIAAHNGVEDEGGKFIPRYYARTHLSAAAEIPDRNGGNKFKKR
ncbi:hypothetical protein OUZ56_031954 [Daphnia magna]|uniref:Uncharacterized protein n=1 Tax=Daphnia magna TaxID=35525 RepID=A0ABQ9ZVT7_9CRUS|nr:hypothetical protein OUZ56_031954 [Daphnia magna]